MTERVTPVPRIRRFRDTLAAAAALTLALLLLSASAGAQEEERSIDNWLMQDASKVSASPQEVSQPGFHPKLWYRAVVPGTLLTTWRVRVTSIETTTANLNQGSPQLLMEGFNIALGASTGSVPGAQNPNATPSHWAASNLVSEGRH